MGAAGLAAIFAARAALNIDAFHELYDVGTAVPLIAAAAFAFRDCAAPAASSVGSPSRTRPI